MICSAIEAIMSLVVGEVEIIGVIASNLADGVAKIAVPANKINCIGKVCPVSSPVTGVGFISFPGFVHRLSISIGRGRSRTWEKTKAGGPSRFGPGLVF